MEENNPLFFFKNLEITDTSILMYYYNYFDEKDPFSKIATHFKPNEGESFRKLKDRIYSKIFYLKKKAFKRRGIDNLEDMTKEEMILALKFESVSKRKYEKFKVHIYFPLTLL